jgi:hypothetical protein
MDELFAHYPSIQLALVRLLFIRALVEIKGEFVIMQSYAYYA